MDVWVGPANFERLWFESYATVDMPIITASPMNRVDLNRDGPPLELADESFRRIWIFSNMFDESSLRPMQTKQWKLAPLYDFECTYPLAVFERNVKG